MRGLSLQQRQYDHQGSFKTTACSSFWVTNDKPSFPGITSCEALGSPTGLEEYFPDIFSVAIAPIVNVHFSIV